MSDAASIKEIEVTPEMIEAGALALAETGEASAAYQAEVAFRAMIKIASNQGLRASDTNR